MANYPVAPFGPDPAPNGRLEIVVNPSFLQARVRCWVNDQQLFTNEKRGGCAIVPPGRHKVTCEGQDRGGFGKVTQYHDVHPGETVVIHYATPMHLLGKGAMGRIPQETPWAIDWRQVGYMVLVLVAIVVIAAVVVVIRGDV